MEELLTGRRRHEKIWKEDCGISAGGGSGSDCGVSGFAASKTAVGKIYLTIDSTVGLKNDSEDVTVTLRGIIQIFTM